MKPEGLRRLAAREEWTDAVLPTIAVRIVLMAFGLLVVVVFKPDAVGPDPWLGIWNRWDAPHFLEIAAHWYGPPSDPARIVLFPLYPLLIAAGSLILPPLLAGMAVSFAATVAAAVGLHRLARFDAPRPAARAAVLAMLVFPTAFAFVAPYSESLFLALAVWSFVRARDGDWPAAGVLGGLAAFTRIQGVFLLPALAVEYWLQRRRLDRDAPWIGAVGLGLVGYLAVNQVAFGDALRFVKVQRDTFAVANVPPWQALEGLWHGLTTYPPGEFWTTVYGAPALAFLALAGASAWCIVSRRSRPSYTVYTLVSLVAFATLSWPISVPRYVLGVFPLFLAMGSLMRRSFGTAVQVMSVLLLGLCLTLFVIGHWAF